MASLKTMPDGSKRVLIAGYWVREVQGSDEIEISDYMVTATRKFLVDADVAVEFARTLKGQIRAYGDIFIQGIPQTHPRFAGLIYCNSARVRPDPKSKSYVGTDGLIRYARSFVDVTYSMPAYGMGDEIDPNFKVFYTEDLDFAVEVLTIPGGGGDIKFDEKKEGGPIRPVHPPQALLAMAEPVEAVAQAEGDDEEEEEEDDVVKQDLNIMIGTQDIVYEFPNLPRVNKNIIRKLRGKTNDKEFQGVGKGRLLFMGAKTRREVNGRGLTISRSLTIVMKEHQYGWNREWKKGKGWTVIDPPLYEYEDFLLLIPQIFMSNG